MNRRERRTAHVRAEGDGPDRVFVCHAVTYGIVDSFNTRFNEGCALNGLGEKLPVIAWNHQWGEPIGRALDYTDRPVALEVPFRLDDDPVVPRAQQARYQLDSGTLTDVSIGFSVVRSHKAKDGIEEFDEIVIDEISVVLAGAVPNAKVLSLRSGQMISPETAAAITVRLSQGEIDLAEALTQLKEAAVDAPDGDEPNDEGEPEPDPDPDKPDEDPDELEPEVDPNEAAELEAAMDEALALVASK